MRKCIFIFLGFLFLQSYSQSYSFTCLYKNDSLKSSIRSLEIDKKGNWMAAGSKSFLAWGNINSGKVSAKIIKTSGTLAEKQDRRALKMLGNNTFLLINAGSPAYFTGGSVEDTLLNPVYVINDTAAFIDGMAFWNSKLGIAYGDPIQGKMLLVKILNSGKVFEKMEGPSMEPGESFFAASNSGILVQKNGRIWIASGGAVARIFYSSNYGQSWITLKTPMIQGKSSQGIFSIAKNKGKLFICGGDFSAYKNGENNAFYSEDNGENWQKPNVSPYGYKSCIKFLSDKTLLCTGITGTDISEDGGLNWKHIDDRSLNVIAPVNAHTALLAGPGSSVYLFKIN